MSNVDLYQKLMQRRGHYKSAAPEEQSWKCLCCRDSGLLQNDLIVRYLGDRRVDLVEEVQILGSSAAPVACNRPGCGGLAVYVEVIVKDDGEEYQVTRQKPKYPYSVLETSIPAAVCQWIHEQEFQRLQQEQPAPLRPAIAQSISTIGNAMPAAAAQSDPLEHREPIVEPDEVAGLHRGDRVTVADKSSDRNGQNGIIRGFDWQQSQGQYVAFVEFDDCSVDTFSPVFLQQIQEAA